MGELAALENRQVAHTATLETLAIGDEEQAALESLHHSQLSELDRLRQEKNMLEHRMRTMDNTLTHSKVCTVSPHLIRMVVQCHCCLDAFSTPFALSG